MWQLQADESLEKLIELRAEGATQGFPCKKLSGKRTKEA